jgi:hypothetical protein
MTQTILIVEDNPKEREIYVKYLNEAFGGELIILEADTLLGAKKVLEAHYHEILAIILDLDIPDDSHSQGHDKPSPVGLKLLNDYAWCCPTIIFSGHADLLTDKNAPRFHPWSMVQKGAPGCEKLLVEHVRKAIEIQQIAIDVPAGIELTEKANNFQSAESTLAAVYFHLSAFAATEAALTENHWSRDPFQEGLLRLKLAASKHHGAIVQVLGTTAVTVFPAIGEDPHHFQSAITALRGAYNGIGKFWNKLVPVPFSAVLCVGAFDGGEGVGAVFADIPGEVSSQLVKQLPAGCIGIPEAYLKRYGLADAWNTLVPGPKSTASLHLADGAAIALQKGSLA